MAQCSEFGILFLKPKVLQVRGSGEIWKTLQLSSLLAGGKALPEVMATQVTF